MLVIIVRLVIEKFRYEQVMCRSFPASIPTPAPALCLPAYPDLGLAPIFVLVNAHH
jgi:hypothetical protein